MTSFVIDPKLKGEPRYEKALRCLRILVCGVRVCPCLDSFPCTITPLLALILSNRTLSFSVVMYVAYILAFHSGEIH